nr:MAG TPA: hypothetical protein [Caudoviricetes sp.]
MKETKEKKDEVKEVVKTKREKAEEMLEKINKEDFKDIYEQIKKWISDEHDCKNLIKALVYIDTDIDTREKVNKEDVEMAANETVEMVMSRNGDELPILNLEILDFFEKTLYDFTKERELVSDEKEK